MKIAILLATHNGELFVKQQIESIIDQDYKDWVLYVSDDCSKDSTLNILESYSSKYHEKIIIISYSMQFGSARDNFFYLLENVDADLFFFSDQDDLWMPNKISIFLEFYNKLSAQEKKRPIILHSDLCVVDTNLAKISNSFFKYQGLNPKKNKIESLLVQNIIAGCSMAINNELKKVFFTKRLKETEIKKILMHDWYFALIAAEFGMIKYIDVPLVNYRQHRQNTVGAKNVRSFNYFITKLMKSKIISDDIEKTKQQAEIFMENYLSEISLKTSNLILKYSKLEHYSFLPKIFFLSKNRMLKHGLVRIIGQFIFS